MESSLTPEQKARIEQNRKLALEKRAARLSQIAKNSSTGCTSSSSTIRNQNISHQQVPKPTNFTPSSSTNKTQTAHSSSTKTFYYNQNNKPLASYAPLSITKTGTSNYGDKAINKAVSKTNSHVASAPQLVKNPASGVCRLISKERFTVDMVFHQQTVDIFRTIREKEYGKTFVF